MGLCGLLLGLSVCCGPRDGRGDESPDSAIDVAPQDAPNQDATDTSIDNLPDNGARGDGTDIASSTPYQLGSVALPKDHVAFPWHVRKEPDYYPMQPRFHAVPKRMYLLDDDRTLRVALYWFNGYGVTIGREDDPEYWVGIQEDEPAYCMEAVDGLLPSGLLYFDIDTETDEVEFVGEVVLSLIAAEQIRTEWSRTVEFIGVMDSTAMQYACSTASEGRGFCISKGGKEYTLEMCRYQPAYLEELYSTPTTCAKWASGGGHLPACQRGCIEYQSGAPVQGSDMGLGGFVDLTGRNLHVLQIHDLEGGATMELALPIRAEQLSKEEALASGCVEGHLDPHWQTACGGESPYYLLSRCNNISPYFDHGSYYEDARDYSSLEDYLENHPRDLPPKIGGCWSSVGYPEAYFSPWEGEAGVIFFARSYHWFQVDATAAAMEWEGGYSAVELLRGKIPPPYGPMGGFSRDIFRPVWTGFCRLAGPGVGWVPGDVCVQWQSGWVQGNRASMEYMTDTVDGQVILRVHLDWSMDALEEDWQETYGSAYGAQLPSHAPPCQMSTYFSIPLLGQGASPKD